MVFASFLDFFIPSGREKGDPLIFSFHHLNLVKKKITWVMLELENQDLDYLILMMCTQHHIC